MFETIVSFWALFVGFVLMGWVLTFIRVRMGYIRHGQEAIEEYVGSVGVALLITGLIFLLGLESLIG